LPMGEHNHAAILASGLQGMYLRLQPNSEGGAA
jgi:hypothetical protein